jgi:hypothetical protein
MNTIDDFLPHLTDYFKIPSAPFQTRIVKLESLPPVYAVPDLDGNAVRLQVQEFRIANDKFPDSIWATCHYYHDGDNARWVLYYSWNART